MQAYQGGDSAAFEMLFRRHKGRVYGFILGRTKNRMVAEDVFQSVFLKLHKSRRLYDPEFPFTPWLFTICRSVITDHVRKTKALNEVLSSEDHAIEVASAEKEEVSAVAMGVDKLPATQKAAIEMRYMKDLEFEEIASRLNTSPDNARKLISRGLSALRASILGKGDRHDG